MTSDVDRPLRIGLISQWYDPEAGSAVTPGVQARALAGLGHRVEVLTGWPHYPTGNLPPEFSKRPYLREQHGDIVVHRVPEYPNHSPRASGRMATYLSFALTAALAAPIVLNKVDVVLVHSTPATAAIPALFARLTRKIPFVLHIQDLWPDTVTASGFAGKNGSRMASVLHKFCDHSYRKASSIAVTSPGMAASIGRRGIDPAKMTFIPNWADETVFRPVVRDPALRAELGLPPEVFVLMYAGNVGHIQGLPIVLEAADRLRGREDIHFAIVGDGVARPELQSQAVTRNLDHVHVVGPQPFSRMGEIIASSDAQLVSFVDAPLFRLTLPSKLQATLAAGSPVIGAVGGDAAQVIRDSGAGLVVPPGDGAALAEAVVAMADSTKTTSDMSAAGRATYESQFSQDLVVKKLAMLLRAAADGGRR